MDLKITDGERRYLLELARSSIAGAAPPPERPSGEALAAPCGAFVTLTLEGKLRGCIGRMASEDPLEETVGIMAREAAFHDPRFPALDRAELPRCHIEISVLSPMELCPDPQTVKVGLHGLYLTHRGRSGVLLPQVPVEQGWNREEYLDYICVKAGLPPHSYEAPGARLYTFTALVFGED